MSNENDRKPTRYPKRKSHENEESWWLRFVPNLKRWSDLNISRFLNIYKTYPVLWDPTNSFYKDESKRMKAYDKIARKLNLYGIERNECIKLIKSLKVLYVEEKEKQTIEKKCNNKKYTPAPAIWYSILEEMIKHVQQKLAKPQEVRKSSLLVVEDEIIKQSETVISPRLYTEDIWTPKHFKTNVMSWFLLSQDDQLICNCSQQDSKTLHSHDINVCNEKSNSTFSLNTLSDSSSEIIQCKTARKELVTRHAKTTCCRYDARRETEANCSKQMNICMNSVRKGTEKKAKLLSSHDCIQNDNKISNEKDDFDFQQSSLTGRICCEKNDKNNKIFKNNNEFRRNRKRGQTCKEKLICCKNYLPEILDACGHDTIRELLPEICTCPKKNGSLSENTNIQTFCSTQATTCRNRESISSKTESSGTPKFYYACRSDSDTTPVVVSPTCNHSPLSLLEEKEKSDHRLDYSPDPTLCEKCAADRVPVQETRKNIMRSEDPRIQELDKYCRYKDWDAIYNIRTQVPDEEEPIVRMDEDLLLTMLYKDQPPRPKRQNHSLTEADINLFTDANPSEARQVSLNNEYKREYGLNIQTDQPKHYACETFEIPGHKPAQLML